MTAAVIQDFTDILHIEVIDAIQLLQVGQLSWSRNYSAGQ